jgi:hypothetical protein
LNYDKCTAIFYEKEEEYFKNAEDTEGLTNILLKTDYYDIS